MKDIQGERDKRNVSIKEVGVSEVFLPIRVADKKKGKQQVIAKISMSTNLSSKIRGTHMSRFLEIINGYQDYSFDISVVENILKRVKERLESSKANIEVAFTYFLEKVAPISKKKFLMDYHCKIIGRISEDNRILKELEVRVPISSVCPCSKAISEKGAHNQRGLITVNITTGEFIWLEELIHIAENEASGILYPLLKRPDEKYVTEKMFKNPKFVEDIVRDIALVLKNDKRVIDFSVKCTSYESIHNHNAYAKVTTRR